MAVDDDLGVKFKIGLDFIKVAGQRRIDPSLLARSRDATLGFEVFPDFK